MTWYVVLKVTIHCIIVTVRMFTCLPPLTHRLIVTKARDRYTIINFRFTVAIRVNKCVSVCSAFCCYVDLTGIQSDVMLTCFIHTYQSLTHV